MVKDICIGMMFIRDMKPETFLAVQSVLESGRCSLIVTMGDSLISRARNIICQRFLDSGSKVLIFIDDDMVFTPEAFFRVTDKCIARGGVWAPVVCTKGQGDVRPVSAPEVAGEYAVGKGGGEVAAKVLGGGGMCIHRMSLELLEALSPGVSSPHGAYSMWFEASKGEDGRYLSEDHAFCAKARQMGVEMTLDLGASMGHIGNYAYDYRDVGVARGAEAPRTLVWR